MGTFNLTITYPDAQQTRIVNALKFHYTTYDPETGDAVTPSTPETIEKLRNDVVAHIRRIVFQVERDAYIASVNVTEVDAT